MIPNCCLNMCPDPTVGQVFALDVRDHNGKAQNILEMPMERFLELMAGPWSGYAVQEVSIPCECTRQRREAAHSRWYALAPASEKAKCKNGANTSIRFYSDVFGEDVQQFLLPKNTAEKIRKITDKPDERTNYSDQLFLLWQGVKYGNRKLFIPKFEGAQDAVKLLSEKMRVI